LAFAMGVAAGAAVAARWRGKAIATGRICAGCGASLSLWRRFPILSWLGARPNCPRCGRAAPRLHAGIEAAVLLIGLAAILLAPLRLAVIWAAAGWLLLFAAVTAWRRLR
jgi:prepilin signal peptidase PulO-like enzyme (type II secretory pathway)